MRVGLISDVHGNLPALEAVLADMPPVDAVLSAGDTVGYYPWPGACVDAMIERAVPSVMGNHDRAVVGATPFAFRGSAQAGIAHAKEHLEAEQVAWLRDLPDDRVALDGRVRVVHGHPRDPDRYTYPEEVTGAILMDEPVLVLGHTHVQFEKAVEGGLVVNPGSVGQPRDGDPRAAYAVLDPEAREVALRRVAYDVERTQAAVHEAGLPASLARRLDEGR
ncbi:MAG: metallophosphoesterase family protein [Halobacteriales archaeon]